MNFYFAPLEGITDSIFRQLHHKYFPGIHRYYTPFISPTVHRSLTAKEQRELSCEQLRLFDLIPQLLTKNADDFIWMAQQCADLGYKEINLNLGCPSGTVTAKGKGSGLLLDPENLDRFLHEIFSRSPIPISIKTRIGFHNSAEFPRLLEIFNKYPIAELILHPRIRSAFYSGTVDMNAFKMAADSCTMPLCYNGDITQLEQIAQLENEYPQLQSVMIGRGLIADPGMFSPGGTAIPVLKDFYNELLDSYIEAFGSARNAMFRLKEHWQYLITHFDNSEKLGKRLRKTTDILEYRQITEEIFDTLILL